MASRASSLSSRTSLAKAVAPTALRGVDPGAATKEERAPSRRRAARRPRAAPHASTSCSTPAPRAEAARLVDGGNVGARITESFASRRGSPVSQHQTITTVATTTANASSGSRPVSPYLQLDPLPARPMFDPWVRGSFGYASVKATGYDAPNRSGDSSPTHHRWFRTPHRRRRLRPRPRAPHFGHSTARSPRSRSAAPRHASLTETRGLTAWRGRAQLRQLACPSRPATVRSASRRRSSGGSG